MPRAVECEVCDRAIWSEVTLSYVEQGSMAEARKTDMNILAAMIPANVIGKLLDGLLGAAGLITAQQARHALGRVIPEVRSMDPTMASVTDAALSMILGGVVQAVAPLGGAIAEPWSTTSISIAQIDLVTRLTGIDLSAPLVAAGAPASGPHSGGSEPLNRLDARTPAHAQRATVGVGALDYRNDPRNPRNAPGRASNIAGVV